MPRASILSFHKIGPGKRELPRLWLESSRLSRCGFEPGTPFRVERPGGRLLIRRVAPEEKNLELWGWGNAEAPRKVSHRRNAGGLRPIIEITGGDLLGILPSEVDDLTGAVARAKTHFGLIELAPSRRTLLIRKSLKESGGTEPQRVLELFAGGGTLGEAARQAGHQIVAGMEINPSYADVWEAKNPDAMIIAADIRLVHPAELPRFDMLLAGIPCTSHSPMGRAKKGLKDRPEAGDTGDLFVHVLNIIGHHMPRTVVLENVPSFGESLSSTVLRTSLGHMGYHIAETILEPHQEWNEPSDRRRWALVASLEPLPEQVLEPLGRPFEGTANDFLDAENTDADQEDATRIAKTIEGLRRHNARHQAAGHGFGFTTIGRDAKKIPTITKSYHKINIGPFVETPSGPRLLRVREIERIMGATAGTGHYATAVEILGQGVQPRIWKSILERLSP
jgi:DNA (cytosine-5)-methyltransferase 1